MKARKRRNQKQRSARELFELCTQQLLDLNRRYESLFRYVHDPRTYSPEMMHSDMIPVTLERDMKAGETLDVRTPVKFLVR